LSAAWISLDEAVFISNVHVTTLLNYNYLIEEIVSSTLSPVGLWMTMTAWQKW
jgi:hypothetical protein